ncbi:MAG: hypothetical protein WD576_00275 [Nitriliruptoraceae bacterium]
MIRLGSLAGYPFEGPRVLAGWTPPPRPAVFAILCRDAQDLHPNDYSVIYVGHADDLADGRLPFRHPAAQAWIDRAGDRWSLSIATYEIPGGLRSHREQLVRGLIAIYRPSCNRDQYDQSWRDEWIGSYQTPTTAPLTTRRTPGDDS